MRKNYGGEMNRYARYILQALAVVSWIAQSAEAQTNRAVLMDPSKPFWKTRAPDTVTADMETSRGSITIELIRDWAPAGVDRFYNLARAGYFDDSRFYRVLYGFVAQFGVAASPAVYQAWARRYIPADPPKEKNVRGTISYAMGKPTDRTTNLFINLADNTPLDSMKFAPIGRVVSGMDVADSLYTKYGEGPTQESWGGNPKRLYYETNKYLDKEYPKLDKIIRIVVRKPN
jgi:cyclophilin family peptidyl-prolyl cis-trans isomerase